ncbi:hypothetical protein [Desulfurobacterium sp.]|uniref:hypothetical protein n=1 Tax=Desulfurobacterium sp. TaxID=2004706 RepID=UPI00260918C5|nr:hypothetical protein [Desulfurobacterium sp.]
MSSENTSIREKYLNWLSLIETDYITMFIKTWFTFLASLQELLNNTKDRSIGDSQVLEEYKNKIFEDIAIQIDDEFIKNVLRSYLQAKNNALSSNTFLKDYFKIFYSYNEGYSQEFSYTYRGKTTKLFLNIHSNSREKHLKMVLTDERRAFIDFFGEKIETGFSLSEKIKISRIFEEKDKFIEEILSAVRQKAENVINSKRRLNERGKRERINFLNDKCLIDIERKLNEELDIKTVFPLKPHNAISTINPNTLKILNKPQYFDEDLTKWFIDFAYKLRNILFHFIIDPMDKDWQLLFKHTYLAFKHITEENIKILQNRGVENDNSNL